MMKRNRYMKYIVYILILFILLFVISVNLMKGNVSTNDNLVNKVNAVENQWIGYNGEVEFDNKNDEFTIYTL